MTILKCHFVKKPLKSYVAKTSFETTLKSVCNLLLVQYWDQPFSVCWVCVRSFVKKQTNKQTFLGVILGVALVAQFVVQ